MVEFGDAEKIVLFLQGSGVAINIAQIYQPVGRVISNMDNELFRRIRFRRWFRPFQRYRGEQIRRLWNKSYVISRSAGTSGINGRIIVYLFIILTKLQIILLIKHSSKSYIFSSGGNNEDIISLWIHIGPPGPPTAGAWGLSTSCP
jgi:hypothetical protein